MKVRLNETGGAGSRSGGKLLARGQTKLPRTFAAKPNVAELDVAKDIDRLDLTCREQMEAVGIVLLLVHLQHPPVGVALNADEKSKINLTNIET